MSVSQAIKQQFELSILQFPLQIELENEKIYLDLYPDDDRIIEQDYLKYSYHFNNGSVLVLGNPPFGGIHLYRKFFINSTKFAKYIAFILPISQLNNDNILYQFDLIKYFYILPASGCVARAGRVVSPAAGARHS